LCDGCYIASIGGFGEPADRFADFMKRAFLPIDEREQS